MEQIVAACYFTIVLCLIHESKPCQPQNLNKLAAFLKTNVTCKTLNLDKERLICDVDDQEGWKYMVCSGHQTCELPEGFDTCSDGSSNMTCLPLEGGSGVYYRCGCHAVLDEGFPSAGEWSEWQMISDGLSQRKYYQDSVFTCITEIAQSKYYQDNVFTCITEIAESKYHQDNVHHRNSKE